MLKEIQEVIECLDFDVDKLPKLTKKRIETLSDKFYGDISNDLLPCPFCGEEVCCKAIW